MTRRNLSDRLAAQSVIGRIIAQRGLTQSDVAARMGLSRQAVQRWAGGATPSLANLRKLADILDVPLKFLTGEVPFAPEALDALIEDSAVVAPLYDSDDLSEQGRLEQERGAVRSITLRSDTGIPGNARPVVVNVHDDAMWPTIKPGDAAIVDTTSSSVTSPGLYALMMLGKARIRRLMPDINGGLTIIADNIRYPREKVDAPNAGSVRVIGSVLLIVKVD